MGHNIERRKSTRKPLKRFYLVCEGKNTEPNYFEALVAHFALTTINLIPVGGSGAPQTIVAKAISISAGLDRKHSFEEGDEVWAVFDCDLHEQYESARNDCRQKGIHLAYSNPCFELWLILHHELYEKSDDHHAVQRHYATLDPHYSKCNGKNCDFSLLSAHVERAEKFAIQQLNNRAAQMRHEGRPSTTVHLLTAKLRGS